MRKNLLIMTLVAGCLLTTGCASKKDLVNCQNENKQLTSDYQSTKEQLAASNARVASLEEQLWQAKNDYAKLQNSLDKSPSNANQNNISIEKLVDLDVQVLKGVVYISLADNMLYKSGSYEINERASETLSKIAKIIMDYKDYEVLIEGNTDDVPISRENIRNNWDLSCLRASSVVQELQNKYGVDPKRLTAGGRGEYNPVASNATATGKQRNRRTQIIITPKLDQFMELIDQAPED